jgi:hypothetical protein
MGKDLGIGRWVKYVMRGSALLAEPLRKRVIAKERSDCGYPLRF